MKVQERKKSKLTKVCVNCTRSALDEIISKGNHFKIANNDSSTSTSYTNNNSLSEEETLKTSAVESKKGSLSSCNQHGDVLLVSPTPAEKADVSSKSDLTKSHFMLLQKAAYLHMICKRRS